MHYPLVTIIGGSGFVGRHTVKLLAQAGYRVRVLVRDTIAAEFLKTAATVGSIAIEHADITRPETLVGKFAGSDAVINLVSIAYESGRQTFHAVNVEGAQAAAAEARKAGIKHFIQISAIGIEAAQDTKYGSSKLAGEQAVRQAFPNATILRPSLIVGPEDRFFQRFARMSMFLPFLPLVSSGKTKFQPVLVTDVATAILDCVRREETLGNTYELAGPRVFTFREMLELMLSITKRHARLITLPLISLKAAICDILPFPPLITRDQVKMLQHDNVKSDGSLGFAELGLAPTPIEDALPNLLSRYVKA